MDMPDAGIYQNLVGIYHTYIPVFNQSDYSICYNYDLICVGGGKGEGGEEVY